MKVLKRLTSWHQALMRTIRTRWSELSSLLSRSKSTLSLDENGDEKKVKPPPTEVEILLDLSISDLLENSELLQKMFKIRNFAPLSIKEKIYEYIMVAFEAKGDIELSTKHVMIQDNVFMLLACLVTQFKRLHNCPNIRLLREKQVVSRVSSVDPTKGYTDYVIMDYVIIEKLKCLVIVETKAYGIEHGLEQCFLAMKAAYEETTGERPMYGFVTTFYIWRMVIYDKNGFQVSDPFLFFPSSRATEKEDWMDNGSDLIDAIYQSLVLSMHFVHKKTLV